MSKGRGDHRGGEEKEKDTELKKEGKNKDRRCGRGVSKSRKNKAKTYHSSLG